MLGGKYLARWKLIRIARSGVAVIARKLVARPGMGSGANS